MAPPTDTAPSWRSSPTMTTLEPASRAWSSRKETSRSAAIPASSSTRTWLRVSRIRSCSSLQRREASVRDSDSPASLPNVLAAWPEVEVPTTVKPPVSKASRTAAMTVVLPDPATPSTNSTPRPEVAIPSTAACWPGVSCDPR